MAAGDHAALHVVTTDDVLARDDFLPTARAIFTAGGPALALHLRGPRTHAATLFALGEALLHDAASSGASLIVNDRIDVALALEADGVHLGRRSLPAGRVRALLAGTGPMSVGVSCHSVAEVRDAREAGADYAFFGAVHETASHPGQKGAGVDVLTRVVASVPGFAVIAIGGIVPAALAGITATGAAGVAAIGGVWDAKDPAEAVRRYISALATTQDAARSDSTGPGIDRPAGRE